MRKNTICLCLSLVAVAALAAMPISPAAAVSYNGEVHSPTSVTGGGVWVSPGTTSLSWIVSKPDDVVGAPWTYSYTLSVPRGEISHWILELTPGVTANDIFNITPNLQTEIRLFKNDDPSTPGMPADIYGIKFDNVNQLTQTFTFQSFIAPVWGDFYARDGVAGGRDNFAFNTTFTDPDPLGPPINGALDCKVLRPDHSPGPVIPEPSSILLGAVGLLPMVVARRRARK